MKKRVLTFVLAVVMLSTTVTGYAVGSTGLGNFVKKNYYATGQFSDVPNGAWYAETVKYAFELDLVKGTSNTTYTPDGNIKIAEALALAARLHSIYYTGTSSFVQGELWYQVYVDYAINNGIIYSGQFSDYTMIATRAQFATILEAAFPNSALQAINNVTDIPDVKQTASFADAVYKLYNAGVLTGSDDTGTFYPGQPIKRSEVATIIARMANPDMRKVLSFGEKLPVITAETTNLVISKVASVSITENVEEGVTVVWDCDSDVVKLQWGEFQKLEGYSSRIPLNITPLKDGEATIKVYVEAYPDEYVTIKVRVQGVSPRITVDTNNLTINKATYIFITENYEENITAVWECDSDVVKLTWGKFGNAVGNKSTAPLTITPLKNGEATIKVYIKQYPNEYVTIKVTVQGMPIEDEQADIYEYLMNYAKKHGTYSDGAYEYRYYYNNPGASNQYCTLVYDRTEEDVAIYYDVEDATSTATTMLFIDPTLEKPYKLGFLYEKASGTTLAAKANIYPSIFSEQNGISFYQKSDTSTALNTFWTNGESLAASMLEASLVRLETYVLTSGGYNLDDLGFNKI